jgi:hypothetical protein
MNSAPYTPRLAAMEGVGSVDSNYGGAAAAVAGAKGRLRCLADIMEAKVRSSADRSFGGGGCRSGNGEIDITEVTGVSAAPESSTWAMMATGFAALGLAGLRRRKA